MKKLVVVLSMVMAFASVSQADHKGPMVNIEKVNIGKVEVNKGGSADKMHHHVLKAMKCMLMLKKYDNMHDAMEAKMAKINEKCDGDNAVIPAKKCKHIKKKIAMSIKNCFIKAEFVREFFKSKTDAAAAVEPAVAAEPAAPAPAPEPEVK